MPRRLRGADPRFALGFFLFWLVGPYLILLLIKYFRSRGSFLNVFRVGNARGSALVAVSRAVHFPCTGSRVPCRNLTFPKGNFLVGNGIMRFLPSNGVFLQELQEFRSSGRVKQTQNVRKSM